MQMETRTNEDDIMKNFECMFTVVYDSIKTIQVGIVCVINKRGDLEFHAPCLFPRNIYRLHMVPFTLENPPKVNTQDPIKTIDAIIWEFKELEIVEKIDWVYYRWFDRPGSLVCNQVGESV